MDHYVDDGFRSRIHMEEEPREGDTRDPYRRDKARIIHSSAFRRMQGKTQVMGTGEGDFHRTRLTHSIETAQIGEGLINTLKKNISDEKIHVWLPPRALIEAACLAHDWGHPPFGHGGEKALHAKMWCHGGFEGNGQTLRILTKLEKYHRNKGLNPTRRLVLAVLKYALPYSAFPKSTKKKGPPKCYFNEEKTVVTNALSPLHRSDRKRFQDMKPNENKPCPQNMTLDASIMEMADDIAYAVHDLEDIVARGLVDRDRIISEFDSISKNTGRVVKGPNSCIDLNEIKEGLFTDWSGDRKNKISKLVNFFISNIELKQNDLFDSPLLYWTVCHQEEISCILSILKKTTYDLVISEAHIQQLEHRGQRIVEALFDQFISDPKSLIPRNAWNSSDENDSTHRRVCDYIAGMTDTFAQKIYQRLFIPGFGSSYDEL